MADVTAAAYQDVRDYIQGAWAYLEIRDGTQAPLFRIGIDPDPRVSWTHAANAQELEVTAVLTGSDADVPVPQAVAGSALFKAASGGSAMHAETFTSFTFNAEADQLTIRHRVQVPALT